jgi:hypothetical protein
LTGNVYFRKRWLNFTQSGTLLIIVCSTTLITPVIFGLPLGRVLQYSCMRNSAARNVSPSFGVYPNCKCLLCLNTSRDSFGSSNSRSAQSRCFQSLRIAVPKPNQIQPIEKKKQKKLKKIKKIIKNKKTARDHFYLF